jgi:rod shape-determining protein MreC
MAVPVHASALRFSIHILPSRPPSVPSYGPSAASRPAEAASPLRLAAYLALAVALIVLDVQAGWLGRLRAQADLLVQPLWMLAGLPGRLGNQVRDNAATHGQLVAENRQLRNQLLIANARLTRLQTAALDNAALRELLGAAERNGLDVQLAPILDIDLDPTRQRLVLDAGSRDGVQMGQAVIDAGGLMGQVIAVTPIQATVLLLTDPDHAVPVTVARSGVRLIAYGRGDHLELRDIPLSAGVQVGDEVVSSGLGGRFPAGFPVGKVEALRPDDTHAFLVGRLLPAAQFDRGRNVLLLRPGSPLRLPAAARQSLLTPAPAPVAPGTAAATAATGAAAAGTSPLSSSPAPAPAPAASQATPATAPATTPRRTPPPRPKPGSEPGTPPAADTPAPAVPSPEPLR